MARLPAIPEQALRDHAGAERVDRIWRRLEPELAARPTASPSPSWVWAPAALAVVFGAGVFVGARWVRPEHAPVLTAERPVLVESPAGRTAPPLTRLPVESERLPNAQTRRGRSPIAVEAEEVAVASEPVEPAPLPAVVPESSPAEWEALAERGDYHAASVALEATGGFANALEQASASQLWTLHDIARASGSRERAISALRRIVRAFPGAQEAPVAAWTLGTLLEQAGDATGAAEAYSLYRRLSPGGDFAEDALAREVDSALSQGNLELSARLVAQYENEFPNGARLEEFRSELGRRLELARRPPADAPAGEGAEPVDPGSDVANPPLDGSVPKAPSP